MSLFAPTFGGFGDFFTIYGIVRSLQRFLQDKYHALDECRELCAYLDEFAAALKLVASLAYKSMQTAPPPLPPSTHPIISCALPPSPASDEYSASLTAVGHAIGVCNQAIQQFQQKLAHNEATLQRDKASTWLYWARDALYEAACPTSSFSVQRESKALKTKLLEEAHIINLILTAHATARQHQITYNQYQSVIRGPSIVVYLTDILNIEHCVPWEFCGSKELLQSFLLFRFSTLQRKGQSLVKRKHYYLELAGTNAVIRSKTWSTQAQPGVHILMNAFLLCNKDVSVDPQICPTCQTRNHAGVVQNGFEVICASCTTTFTIHKAPSKSSTLDSSVNTRSVITGHQDPNHPTYNMLNPCESPIASSYTPNLHHDGPPWLGRCESYPAPSGQDAALDPDISFIRRVSVISDDWLDQFQTPGYPQGLPAHILPPAQLLDQPGNNSSLSPDVVDTLPLNRMLGPVEAALYTTTDVCKKQKQNQAGIFKTINRSIRSIKDKVRLPW